MVNYWKYTPGKTIGEQGGKVTQEGGTWTRDQINWSIVITHNGDFDGWAPYDGQMVTNAGMGTYLKHVLHCENTANGDSTKYAGIMDLILTQGVWWKSLRMAYALDTLEHVDQCTNWVEGGITCVPTRKVFESGVAA
jgi:hypothetical protein